MKTSTSYCTDKQQSSYPILLPKPLSSHKRPLFDHVKTGKYNMQNWNYQLLGAQIGAQAADYAAARYNHTTEALSLNESEPNAYSESSLRPSFAAVSKSNLFIYSGITTLKINPSLHTVRPVTGYLLEGSNSLFFTKTYHQLMQYCFQTINQSHANIISAGLSEYSEPPWTSGKLQLRPINKILHLWNPEESSHDPSPILQTASSLPNLGILRCSFSSTDIIKTVRNKDNLSKDVSQPKNDWKYKKIKSDLSLNKNKCSNEPKHCSFKFKETQSNSEMDVESNSESSDSHSTENIYIEIEEKKYLPVWSEPFVVCVQRNTYQMLGFSVSCLPSLFGQKEDGLLFISGISHYDTSQLQVGDRILSVNQVELKSLDTVKSVELLKTVLPPVYLQVQRLNTINLRDNIDYVEDLSSTDTFTEDDIEIIQRIINDFEERVFNNQMKIQDQSKLSMTDNTETENIQQSITEDNMKNVDIQAEIQMPNRCARVLRRKVLQWLHTNQVMKLLKGGTNPTNKEKVNTTGENPDKQSDSEKDDSTLYGDDESEDSFSDDDEDAWKNDKVPTLQSILDCFRCLFNVQF
uniref:PDZ domain-containing protein n=1 Tax=Trichobilharzia regenti TaxID=157069 RepID=A0AA85JF79_TRIRE|nr:unnamed protein product [Trichobilharzia regenti]